MTPQERELLTNLSDRLRSAPAQKRDAEAEQAIAELVRARPDAPYLLAQTVLIQDYALHQAQARIAELEKQQAEPQEAESGSFLGSLFGRGQPAAPVRRPAAPPQPAPAPMAASPWGGTAAGPFAQGGGGSSFLRSAAATAAGVAGGALLFQGIESLLGLGHGGFGGFANAAGLGGLGAQPGISETVINNYYEDPASVLGGAQDASIPDFTSDGGGDILDAGYDPGVDPSDGLDSGDFGGGDFGGGDFGTTDV
jgi:hypothetical protein